MSATADAALRAIAHPGRRLALHLASSRARSSGELAEACGWTRPATSQHLKVLRDAGLLRVRKQGQRRMYEADLARVGALRAFLDDFWRGRLAELGEHIDRSTGQRVDRGIR